MRAYAIGTRALFVVRLCKWLDGGLVMKSIKPQRRISHLIVNRHPNGSLVPTFVVSRRKVAVLTKTARASFLGAAWATKFRDVPLPCRCAIPNVSGCSETFDNH
jgi:hypothetical protein